MQSTAVFFLFAGLALTGALASCPPPGFDAVSPFNITQYIAKSWYIQEQRPLVYQPEDSLYCVVATYELRDADDPSKGLTVYNYANEGRVNRLPDGRSPDDGDVIRPLRAVIPDLDEPSKLEVGFPVLATLNRLIPDVLFGDYWIVAVGPSADPVIGYDWAIVSGGAPRVETDGGCRTGSRFGLISRFQTNNVGLWLFSRNPVDVPATETMRKVAADLGFDVSVLKKVEQQNCLYEGARIK